MSGHDMYALLAIFNLHASKRCLSFTTRPSPSTIKFLSFFARLGLIHWFSLQPATSWSFKARIHLPDWRGTPMWNKINLLSSPSKSYFITLKSLRLVAKRTFGSTFMIATHLGIISHTEAITLGIGGVVVGFIH